MNTLYISIRRPVRRLAVVTIVAALAVGFAVIVTLWADSSLTFGAMLGSLGDYFAAVGDALGDG